MTLTRSQAPCITRLNLRTIALALLFASLLAGCGQRGPLYLPDEAPPQPAQGQAADLIDPLEEELEEEGDLQDGNLKDESPDGP